MAKRVVTFSGETPAEAMKKARDELGDEIQLLETKEVRKKSPTQAGLYEMVFVIDEETSSGTKPQAIADSQTNAQNPATQESELPTNSVQARIEEIAQKQLAKKRAQKVKGGDEATIQLSNLVREVSQIAGVSSPRANELKTEPNKRTTNLSNTNPYKNVGQVQSPIDTPPLGEVRLDSKLSEMRAERQAERVEIKELRDEMGKVNDRIKLIQNMFWQERAPNDLHIPQEFSEIYRIAKESGMSKEHLDMIMRLSLELMPLRMRENSVMTKRYFREVLRKMIYCRTENLQSTQKRIMMFVGPTGVGKTTTLAKLAARYSLMVEKRHKVGIITLDTYRLAAVDQLMAYARMMRLSIDTVVEPQELGAAIDALKHCDFILIDTAGHSQNDKQKFESIKKFVDNDYKIDVSLVLALNVKYEDLRDTYNAFANYLDIDTMIFSKLDESRYFGNMFSLVYESKKPISYLSIGQGVPNDLVVANNDYLVDCLLEGFEGVKEKMLI